MNEVTHLRGKTLKVGLADSKLGVLFIMRIWRKNLTWVSRQNVRVLRKSATFSTSMPAYVNIPTTAFLGDQVTSTRKKKDSLKRS